MFEIITFLNKLIWLVSVMREYSSIESNVSVTFEDLARLNNI